VFITQIGSPFNQLKTGAAMKSDQDYLSKADFEGYHYIVVRFDLNRYTIIVRGNNKAVLKSTYREPMFFFLDATEWN
jgi:hypothetical protein